MQLQGERVRVEHEVGEEEVVGGVEVDHREEEEGEEREEEVRFGEQEAFLHGTCMYSQHKGKSTSLSVYTVDKMVIGQLAQPIHLANLKALANKEEVVALLKMRKGEQLAGATRLREKQRQLRPSLTWRSRQDC